MTDTNTLTGRSLEGYRFTREQLTAAARYQTYVGYIEEALLLMDERDALAVMLARLLYWAGSKEGLDTVIVEARALLQTVERGPTP